MKSNERRILFKRLDTTGIIFPSVSGSRNTNVFRITAVLKETVDPELLQAALEKAVRDMPSFRVKLKRGLFWYYFETNTEPVFVEQEHEYPCRAINKYKNNQYLFRILYYEHRIHLEVFHVLCDGNGAMQFLKCLLYHYLILKYPQKLSVGDIPAHSLYLTSQTDEDSYPLFVKKTSQQKSPIEQKAFCIRQTRMSREKLRILVGEFSVNQMLEISHKHHTTLTAVLATALIMSIYQTQYKPRPNGKPIVISVPVDMRNLCDSHTVRNFFITINLRVDFSKKAYTFDEVLEMVSEQLAEKTKKDYLLQKAEFNVRIQQNKWLMFLPLFLKKIGLYIAYLIGERTFTCTLSNMGRTSLEKPFSSWVDHIHVTIGGSHSKPLKCTVCSYESTMKVAFSSTAYDQEIEAYFFRLLASMGVQIQLSTNEV